MWFYIILNTKCTKIFFICSFFSFHKGVNLTMSTEFFKFIGSVFPEYLNYLISAFIAERFFYLLCFSFYKGVNNSEYKVQAGY